jgi:DNA repair ATPase RecN
MEFKKFLQEQFGPKDQGGDTKISAENLHSLINLLDEKDYNDVYKCIMDVLDELDPLGDCDDPEGDDCFKDPMEFTDEFDLEIYETFEDFLANEDTFNLTEEDLNEIKQRFTNKKKGNRKFKKRKVQLKRDRISKKAELRKKRLQYRVKKRKNMAKKKNYRKTYNKAVSTGKHKKKFHR